MGLFPEFSPIDTTHIIVTTISIDTTTMFFIFTLLLLSSYTLASPHLEESTDAAKEATNGEFSPDPCFPLCTTDSGLTSPKPERGCVKTDCFDEALCSGMCGAIMHCHEFECVSNHDDNDIFGETWCATNDSCMCYCCACDP